MKTRKEELSILIVMGVYRNPSQVPKLNHRPLVCRTLDLVFVFNTILVVEISSAHPNVP